MRTRSMICPNCNAELEYSDDKKVMFCSYCGAKLAVEEDKIEYVHRKIDEAKIKKVELEERIYKDELDDKRMSRRIKFRVILGYVAVVAFLILIGILIREKNVMVSSTLFMAVYLIISLPIVVYSTIFIMKNTTTETSTYVEEHTHFLPWIKTKETSTSNFTPFDRCLVLWLIYVFLTFVVWGILGMPPWGL